jgi:hypothetical protein
MVFGVGINNDGLQVLDHPAFGGGAERRSQVPDRSRIRGFRDHAPAAKGWHANQCGRRREPPPWPAAQGSSFWMNPGSKRKW